MRLDLRLDLLDEFDYVTRNDVVILWRSADRFQDGMYDDRPRQCSASSPLERWEEYLHIASLLALGTPSSTSTGSIGWILDSRKNVMRT